ncbi:BMP family ABC transporter substrate-binding protein [Spiractinospora alimapuensis]|nr:BMP family ABC transporter substrate-binding protein [Spiractinospora alimapuensis]QVQ54769.1 BMP family ABC transporter substrate-binding protein [Spiractinospora alimapuensis]
MFGIAATASALALTMTACSNGDDSGDDGGGGEAGDIRVGLAYDIGGRGDLSFNDAAYAGLELVESEMDVEINDVDAAEEETDSDKMNRLELMADEGYNPVIAVGFAYADAIAEVAPNYPDVSFAIVDENMEEHEAAETEDLSNISSLMFAENEGSFLAGAAAALSSEADHIGYVGGVQVPMIESFEAGFVAGAQEVNPDIEVESAYVSQPPDFSGFQDPARGGSIADGQIDAGADVIYHAAGGSGIGVLDSAAENEISFIGVDSDQYLTAEDEQQEFVITSMIKRVDTAVFDFVASVADGTVEGGVTRFNLENDGVDLADTNEEAYAEFADEIEELRQRVIDGDIEVPTEP